MQPSNLQYLPLKLPLYLSPPSFQQLPNQQSQQVRVITQNNRILILKSLQLACYFLGTKAITGHCIPKPQSWLHALLACTIFCFNSCRSLSEKLLSKLRSFDLPLLQMQRLSFAGATTVATAEAGHQRAPRLATEYEAAKAGAVDKAPIKPGQVLSSQSLCPCLFCVSRAKPLAVCSWNLN